MKRRYDAIGLDMDGTLLNTKVNYTGLSNLIFSELAKMGVPDELMGRSEGAKFSIDGATGYLIRAGRAEEVWEMERRIKDAALVIEMENVHLARPFPGAVKVLEDLKDEGYSIGVLTRGSRHYAEAALKTAGVCDLLDALVCRDDYHESEAKPSPLAMDYLAKGLGTESSRILYVGDHRFDHDCAKASGAGFVAVLSGTFNREDWAELGNGFPIIETVASLPEVF